MNVSVKEVTTRKELKRFAEFPNLLYADNPYYVPQIVSMDCATLDKKKNHAFEVCDGRYWLAYDDSGRIVGRIAGIINHRYNQKVGQKICRFSWLDFIDDVQVSRLLMDTVEQYAREQGMELMSGPTGFLEFDAAGVLVEGFDRLPTPYGKYNDPYYESHLLKLGYEKEIDYVEYLISVPDELPERYFRAARMVAEQGGFREAPIRSHRDILRYIDGVFRCMNAAYSTIHGYSELSRAQCEDLKKQFFHHVSPDFLSVILNKKDEVVGFGLCMPSLAKAMQKAKGTLFPFGFIHILRAIRHNDTLDALLIAIAPEYQSKGVNAMIFDKLWQGIRKNGIRYIESTRELENNKNVQNLWNRIEHRQHKRARVYRKDLK